MKKGGEKNMRQGVIVAIIAIAAVGFIGYSLMNSDTTNVTTVENTPTKDTSESVGNDDSMNTDSQENNMKNTQNIVEIAASDEQFSTLITAVEAAGLVETLSSGGPFTVFAPTNDAFSKLPKATLDEVLADKEQLTAILTYHVVTGKVMAEDVVNIDSAETVQGSKLKFTVEGNTVMVDNAKVVNADIEAENGVIHVIDTVLIPR